MMAIGLALLPWTAGAAEVMTLQQCRDSAIANNKELKIAAQQIEIAGHDRKIALANYFPNISASAAYMYNSRNIDLLTREQSDILTNLGTSLQGSVQSGLENMLSDPGLLQIIQKHPEILQLLGSLSDIDISGPVNAIGAEIDKAFNLDIQNMFVGAVSLQQPIFMGGKIVNANKMAKLAEELAQTQYDTQYREVVTEVDNAYWQIVSIANKLKLAQEYCGLLEMMLHDTEVMVNEGVATQADLLSVKVKANEAAMLRTKATNGLALSKMLLCKLCGLELDSDIELADEKLDRIPLPQTGPRMSDTEIFSARPEIRSLDLARQIYDRKVAIARADMMPKVALTANYFVTNPNLYRGFQNKFGGMFNVGVAVNIPIIHGCEAMQKVRKAKAESVLTGYRLADAKEKVSLQVAQLRKQEEEVLDKLDMAESNLASAEENLRTATVGYTEGVVPANTLMAAQTAWIQAHSEYIDAGVELQITASSLATAEGRQAGGSGN